MKIYFAPLEGITGYVYRNAYRDCFGNIDKYFIPFVQPKQHGNFSSREINDLLPEHNSGMEAVPQILTNSAEDFLHAADKLKSYGYREVNLNLGCPSRTVVSKGRGSGFLAQPEELDRFLDTVMAKAGVEVSVKTRVGKNDSEDWGDLLQIFNRYPLKELIVHPRIQKDFYSNTPDWEKFDEALAVSKHPLCYNGDIFTLEDYQRLISRFPETECVMLGRGLLMNPGLAGEITGGRRVEKGQLRKFHDRIYRDYREVLFGEKTVLFKMKEFWSYLSTLFTDSGKYAKKIRKAEKLAVYESVVDGLFREQEIIT